MGFQKGHQVFAGSEHTRFKKGLTPWNKGLKTPAKTLLKLRGRKRSDEVRARMSEACKGREISAQARVKISAALQGIEVKDWKGIVTPANKLVRKSIEYKLWRTAVFQRDNYTCRSCDEHGGVLHAHHIKPFALFPELRFAIDNGSTLCIPCHKKTDTYLNNKIVK